MKLKKWFVLLLFLSIFLLPVFVSADLAQYSHAGKGYTISSSRGLSLHNKELEASRTDILTLGVELKPNILQLCIPFGSYEVDTKGNMLPLGTVRAKSIGTSLLLGFGGERWTPFIGVGGSFHSFQEQFKTMGNLENSFGADVYAGLRFRLAENLWNYLKLRGVLYYQGTLLKPGMKVPDHPNTTSISMNRHSIMLALEVVGL